MEGRRNHHAEANGGQGQSTQGSMQRLWEEIHLSRLSIDNDRKAYEKGRIETDSLNNKINHVSRQCTTAANRIKEVQELQAIRSTELSHFGIKDRVVNESLERVEDELRKAWDALISTRKKVMELTSRYLNESTNFAQMWNCTELGRRNREALHAKKLEDLRRMKHRMEYDLEEFLVKLNRVKEAKQEMVDLEKEFRGQEVMIQNREKEAYNRLRETDEALDQLWKKQDVITRGCEEEVNRLQQKLQQTRGSISHWERRVSENQRTVEHQRGQVAKDRSPVTAAGISNRFMTQQHNANMTVNTSVSSNKCAKIYQPVKPTVKTNQLPATNAPTATISKKPMFQKPPTVNPSTQQQFNHTVYQNTGQSFSSNHNSSNGNSSHKQENCASLPSSTFFPNKSATTSTSSGRVFQFKKKPTDGPDNSPNATISGPTQRSVTVSLGSTPFATFQNGRAVLQVQQHKQRILNQTDFSNDKR